MVNTTPPSRDKIFDRPMNPISAFRFDNKVAEVFDDMVTRSVPIYHQTHQLILSLVDRLFPDKGKIYDLGCSTGTTIAQIHQQLTKSQKSARFVGVDASEAMLDKCREKLQAIQLNEVELRPMQIEDCQIESADLVIMNYTLQFITPAKRLDILQNIYQGLRPGGLLVLSEKLKSPHATIDALLIDLYYDFKRHQGYSELEISQKREALENVLVPLTQNEQLNLLEQAGFVQSEVALRWCNFACFIAIKPGQKTPSQVLDQTQLQ